MGCYICPICGEMDYTCDCERLDLTDDKDKEIAALKAKLARVGEVIERFYNDDGLNGFGHMKCIATILSAEPKVLAVVEGHAHKSNLWYDDQLDVWPDWFDTGSAYVPATVIVLAKEES